MLSGRRIRRWPGSSLHPLPHDRSRRGRHLPRRADLARPVAAGGDAARRRAGGAVLTPQPAGAAAGEVVRSWPASGPRSSTSASSSSGRPRSRAGPACGASVTRFVKRVVRKLTAWYIEPRWTAQIDFDAATAWAATESANAIGQQAVELQRLSQSIERIERMIEAMTAAEARREREVKAMARAVLDEHEGELAAVHFEVGDLNIAIGTVAARVETMRRQLAAAGPAVVGELAEAPGGLRRLAARLHGVRGPVPRARPASSRSSSGRTCRCSGTRSSSAASSTSAAGAARCSSCSRRPASSPSGSTPTSGCSPSAGARTWMSSRRMPCSGCSPSSPSRSTGSSPRRSSSTCRPRRWSGWSRPPTACCAPAPPMVLETIDPRSVFALCNWFYADLSHVRPVYPPTLAFLCETAGFSSVEILPRSPHAALEMAETLPETPEGSSDPDAAGDGLRPPGLRPRRPQVIPKPAAVHQFHPGTAEGDADHAADAGPPAAAAAARLPVRGLRARDPDRAAAGRSTTSTSTWPPRTRCCCSTTRSATRRCGGSPRCRSRRSSATTTSRPRSTSTASVMRDAIRLGRSSCRPCPGSPGPPSPTRTSTVGSCWPPASKRSR